MTLEELKKIKNETLPQLNLRVNQCPIKIFVATGDSGLKAGSRIVLQEALETVYNLGLNNVMITQMPECEEGLEVQVDVVMEDETVYHYVNVDKVDMNKIIINHIVGKKVVKELLAKEVK